MNDGKFWLISAENFKLKNQPKITEKCLITLKEHDMSLLLKICGGKTLLRVLRILVLRMFLFARETIKCKCTHLYSEQKSNHQWGDTFITHGAKSSY